MGVQHVDLVAGLNRLVQDYGLVAVYVFGSRAEEIAARVGGGAAPVAHPDSDVDIGVQPERGRSLSARDRVRLMHGLEELLDVGRVDLVILPEANAYLAADAVRGELLAASDLDAEAEVQLYHLRRAADEAPFLREEWEAKVGGKL